MPGNRSTRTQQALVTVPHTSSPDFTTTTVDTTAAAAAAAAAVSTSDSTSNIKSFPCSQCTKSFSRRENLSRHRKIHKSTRAHGCTTCGKTFTRSDLLSRHVILHNPPEVLDDSNSVQKRRRVTFEDDPTTESMQHQAPGSLNHVYQSVIDAPHAATNVDHNILPGENMNHNLEDHMLNFGHFDSTFPMNGWFDEDFYAAVRETGDYMSLLGGSPFGNDSTSSFDLPQTHESACTINENPPEHSPRLRNHGNEIDNDEHHAGRISRVSSPPNEASYEDKWAFAWNPVSHQIFRAHPIFIPDNHPLYADHNKKYDVTDATYKSIDEFLGLASGIHQGHRPYSFTLPPLRIANLFISLFIKDFLPQMPVLHLPTLNMDGLPPALLAIMIVIGSIKSNFKHTRRFSIVLLDVVRQSIYVAIEKNNALMREPLIIYAETLICYTGLYCGNKRAFELAEALRGTVITHMRRLGFELNNNHISPSLYSTTESQWKHWIAIESHKRLSWTVYGMDGQFSALLDLPHHFTVHEMVSVGCPCDEEFWTSPSSKSWKRLLGPASMPSSRSLAAALGPFLASPGSVNQTAKAASLNLNDWTRFLVLLSIQLQIFEYSLQRSLFHKIQEDTDSDSDEMPPSLAIQALAERKQYMTTLLYTWTPSQNPLPSYFKDCATLLFSVSHVHLALPISDLQAAIGKAGPAGIPPAMESLRRWTARSPLDARDAVLQSIRCIDTIHALRAQNTAHKSDVDPYAIITFFLCHVLVWAYVSVVDEHGAKGLRDACGEEGFEGFVKGLRGKESGNRVFRRAAEGLCGMGTWGSALNMALLLQKRAEM